MKIIVLPNGRKINYPYNLFKRFGYGSDENKIKILLRQIYDTKKDMNFKIEETDLDFTCFHNVVWEKTEGYYYILPATTANI